MAIPPIDVAGFNEFWDTGQLTPSQQKNDRIAIEAVRLTEIETGTTLRHLQTTGQSTVAFRAIYDGHLADLRAELAAIKAVAWAYGDAARTNAIKRQRERA